MSTIKRTSEVLTDPLGLPPIPSSTGKSVAIHAWQTPRPHNFKSWKAEAKGFSWKLFAISPAFSDKFKEKPHQKTADVFHTFASEVIRENQWNKIHGMTIWANLPKRFKDEWKEAQSAAEANARPQSPCTTRDTPRFTSAVSCDNGQWAYFSFQAAAGSSSTSVVHNGLQAPEESRTKLPVLQRKRKTQAPAQAPRIREDPNSDGATLPAAKVIRTADITRESIQTVTPTLHEHGSFVDPFGVTQHTLQDVGVPNFFEAPTSDNLNTTFGSTQHFSNFDSIVAELEASFRTNAANAPGPTLELATGLPEGIPSFDFRDIFPSFDQKISPSHGFSLPPSSEKRNLIDMHDGEEGSLISFQTTAVQPAQKRRRLNLEGDAKPSDRLPPPHPSVRQPFPLKTASFLDDLLGLDVSTCPTVMPNSRFLTTSNEHQTSFYDVSFTGGERGEQVSHHDGVRLTSGPWSLAEATVASSSGLQHQHATVTTHGPRFDPGLNFSCITTPESWVEPQNTTPISMLGSGLSIADSALLLNYSTPEISIDNLLSVAEHPSSIYSGHQELTATQRSTYDLLAGIEL